MRIHYARAKEEDASVPFYDRDVYQSFRTLWELGAEDGLSVALELGFPYQRKRLRGNGTLHRCR